MTREDKIRQYAFQWWEIRKSLGQEGTPERDWQIGEEQVALDEQREKKRVK